MNTVLRWAGGQRERERRGYDDEDRKRREGMEDEE